MAKFFGKIGYVMETETAPGVWTNEPIERSYKGDLIQNRNRVQTSINLNDNLVVSNEVSIVSDPFAMENFHWIRYVKFMGAKWKVTGVKVNYPRLILSLGDVYNG